MAQINEMNMFTMAEKYMLNEVKAKVERDVIEDMVEQFRVEITRQVKEATQHYAITGIERMQDMTKMEDRKYKNY